MFIELTRKDNGEKFLVNVREGATLGVDADGVGVMIILKNGIVRTARESYDKVSPYFPKLAI